MSRVGLLLVAVIAICSVVVRADCVDQLEVQCLERADYPGTVCVTLLLTVCEAPFDAFGVEIEFPSDYMSYVDLQTGGTLCADWDEVSASGVEGTPGRLRVGGYDVTGCGLQARGSLVRLCFDLTSEVPSGSRLEIDASSMVDDLEGAEGIGCRMPSITPIDPSTWGRIKALFE